MTYDQLNVLFVKHNTKNITLAYKSKHDANRTNHLALLMLQMVKNYPTLL